MKQKYLVIGAGGMGEAIAYDILKYNPKTSKVHVVDANENRTSGLKISLERSLEKRLSSKNLTTEKADASDYERLEQIMKDYEVIINASSYEFNEGLTKAAIKTGRHFLDLGGNNDVVAKQFALHEKAKRNRCKIIPAQGIAPGAVSIISELAVQEFKKENNCYPQYVKIFCGGIPRHPKGMLKYMLTFSVKGLINEYKEKAEVIKNFRRKEIDPLMILEDLLIFEDPRFDNGKLVTQAAATSGGLATLTETYEFLIENVEYNTLRHYSKPSHWEIMAMLKEDGFFEEDKVAGKITARQFTEQIKKSRSTKNEEVLEQLGFLEDKLVVENMTPRMMTEHLIERSTSYNDQDLLLVKIITGNSRSKNSYELVDFFDEKTGHRAMQRTTGYSASIVAQMLAQGKICNEGVLRSEVSIPPKLFVKEWKKRGLVLKKH
ncbi:MAG: saccharopine dehydrogenase NADP-binding domain-containing protein [Nanoarchaeota archaeon]|nr:saccharopine dehydrogenase NADP-binding domain-containing protein [Nanoarchaeota archaeon]MBU1644416.1 saccharopine dehydrogenase NADP-binding domain-containing protein [Nanoarchaeota archaeon]MBU1977500.1 saccharopine dehydrogenase NADP-binding domain-containing protein [Nanoarchaeota archaeon]